MIVIGIDPGTRESGYVVWDGKKILDKGIMRNELLLDDIRGAFRATSGTYYVVEGVQYFGKPVGSDIFETCYFIGRIMEAAVIPIEGQQRHLVYRKDVKLFLCGTVRAKDKDVRQALIDRLGKEVTKGVASHVWSALSVAVYYYQILVEKENLEKKRIE